MAYNYSSPPTSDFESPPWEGLNTDVGTHGTAQDAGASERHFRLIVDSVPGLVLTTTVAGEFEFLNRQLLEYFGRSLEELQAWQANDTVHPHDLDRVIDEWRRGIASRQPYATEHRLRRADGVYRWFQVRMVPGHDATEHFIRWYCLLTDIDDLKRAEEVLRSTQARLSRAAHLATVSELSASIAHEVNQPLAAVVANGHACRQWLSAEPPNVERALLSAERVIRDGNSAADIISRIRSLFRRALPVKDLLDMNEVIEEVCSLIADDLRTRGVMLRIDLQTDLPQTAADRIQMQQVVANLARNGIEAMDAVHARPKQLLISSHACDGEIAVHVTDHGVGLIEPDTVFEPLSTTKTSGMGMGLAICRSIIEAHGGRLWATHNVPHGATFGFALRIAGSELQ
jgi:PAS domain S-box-containing protein